MEQKLPVPKQRNGTIDFLKFLFALVVLIFHGRKLASGNEFALLQSGYLAVEFFFLVSGYLMMKSASRVPQNSLIGHETATFLSHKIKGLYPAILFAFLAALITVLAIGLTPYTVETVLTSVWEIFLLRMSGIQGMTINTITWYISAMLIAMLALYPLILKFRKNFGMLIAPFAAILLFGYLSQTGNLASPEKWMDFVYRGIPRALGGLCVGCVCYEIAEYLKKKPFTLLSRRLLFILQWACIVISLCIMNVPGSKLGYVCILLLAVAVTIAFSGVIRNWNPPPVVEYYGTKFAPGWVCSACRYT